MDIWQIIFGWFENIVTDVGGMAKVLTFSFEFNGQTFNVFTLLTLSGLLIYLVVAIIKWAVS